MELYCCYIDDILVILRGINPGWHYCQRTNKLKYDPKHEDTGLPEDQCTLKLLQTVANTLDPEIQTTVDCTNLNEDGRLPLLDLLLFVWGQEVLHSFYSKPMASSFVVKYQSTLGPRTKRESHSCKRG